MTICRRHHCIRDCKIQCRCTTFAARSRQYGKENEKKKVFPPNKCNSVTRNKNPIKFNNSFRGHPLKWLEEAKYIVLIIRQDLNWKGHVNNVCTKVNKTLGFLRPNFNTSSTSVEEQAYKSFVRPSLACSAYNKGEIDQLEMVQRKVARFITNRQRNTSSVVDMLQHLNWCSLEDRRKDAWLVVMYKIAKENVVITKTDRL